MAAHVVRGVFATAGTAAALFVLARASATPVPQPSANLAQLRVSWRARPERIEVCRTLSAEELAKREEHMRQRVECTGRFATYDLRVDTDGRTLHQSVVRGAGLRHDRPLYVLREIEIAPGVHRVHVSFVRRETTDNDAAAFARVASPDADTGLFAGRAQREAIEHERRARAAIPPTLTLDTTLTFAAGRVVVVTFGPDGGLQVLGEPTRPR